MGDKKKLDKIRLKGLVNKSISMAFFLTHIMGVRNEELIKKGLTHRDLSVLFPNLERSSYNYILDNPQTVYQGDIVLVVDANEVMVPYVVTPELKKRIDYDMDNTLIDFSQSYSETWVKEKDDIPDVCEYDLASLSIYELKKLLKIYSDANQAKNYECVRKELICRKDSIQGCRISKGKAMRRALKFQRFDDDNY